MLKNACSAHLYNNGAISVTIEQSSFLMQSERVHFGWHCTCNIPGIILCLGSANERRRYYVMPSLIGHTHTQNGPCIRPTFIIDMAWRLDKSRMLFQHGDCVLSYIWPVVFILVKLQQLCIILQSYQSYCAWIILDMSSVNERRRYNVSSSLIGWAHTQNDPVRDVTVMHVLLWNSVVKTLCLT